VEERRARGSLHERAQLAPGATVRDLLERVPAREHQRDHGAGEVLAQGERAEHRDERDRVDADVAAEQRARHGDRQRDEQERRRRCPGQVRRCVDAHHVEHEPAHDTDQGQQRKQPRGHADRLAAAGRDGIRSNPDGGGRNPHARSRGGACRVPGMCGRSAAPLYPSPVAAPAPAPNVASSPWIRSCFSLSDNHAPG
jgi:hypothetical protein